MFAPHFSFFCLNYRVAGFHSIICLTDFFSETNKMKTKRDKRYDPCCCSVAESCLTICDPWTATCQAPVFHYLPEFAQIHVHWIGMLSNHLIPCSPFSFWLQFFPTSGSFPVSRLFASGGQSTRASASASVLPMNFQDWSPLFSFSFVLYFLNFLI